MDFSFGAKIEQEIQPIYSSGGRMEGMLWNGMKWKMEWNGSFGMEFRKRQMEWNGRFQEWNGRQPSIFSYQFHTRLRTL